MGCWAAVALMEGVLQRAEGASAGAARFARYLCWAISGSTWRRHSSHGYVCLARQQGIKPLVIADLLAHIRGMTLKLSSAPMLSGLGLHPRRELI